MTIRYANHINRKETPQSEPIPGEQQVQNNAGGYVYEIDKWARLQRFLILGSDGGTYYVRERELTRDNAQVVDACVADDFQRAINMIVDVSDAGRAPKNDPAILALAIAASAKDPAARAFALANLEKVCRIPTHLFHFVTFLKAMRGFGPSVRKAIERWYQRWTPEQLAFEVVKYQSRDGWSHRDVFRLAHPKLGIEAQPVMRWAIGTGIEARTVTRKNQGWPKGSAEGTHYGAVHMFPSIIEAYERARTASPTELVSLIRQHKLTREMVPTEKLGNPEVWEALLPNLGLTAILRNLNKMTAVGLLDSMSDATAYVTKLLGDQQALRKARVHPLNVLNALRVYSSGHGDKGSLTWTPIRKIVDALDAAFYASFGNVTPTNKRLMLALDVSGSMSSPIAGTGLSCREACAALALITANVEQQYEIVGFMTSIEELAISPRQRLDDVTRYLSRLNFGGTDCSQPMLYALKRKMDIDAFCVYTDSETWAGHIHPQQALRRYRDEMTTPTAKEIVVGMTATKFSIADPKDPRTLDVVGFDLQTPEAISGFVSE